MIDREKVIRGLECCARNKINDVCPECDYFSDCLGEGGMAARLAHDALTLLEGQEPGRDCVDRGLVIDGINQMVMDPNLPQMICSTDVFEMISALPTVELEAQEAIPPEVEVLNEIDRIYRCPMCHKSLFYREQKYCDRCGKAVKWK